MKSLSKGSYVKSSALKLEIKGSKEGNFPYPMELVSYRLLIP
jgi:hypothetical protein